MLASYIICYIFTFSFFFAQTVLFKVTVIKATVGLRFNYLPAYICKIIPEMTGN